MDDLARNKLNDVEAPEVIKQSLRDYFDHGLRAGSWTRAILANDLHTALLALPDNVTLEQVKALVHWL